MATLTIDDFLRVIPERIAGDSDTITGQLDAGQRLKIETSEDGEEIASILIPPGKVCRFSLYLAMELFDA